MSSNSTHRAGFVFALAGVAIFTVPALAGADPLLPPAPFSCSPLSSSADTAGWGNPFAEETSDGRNDVRYQSSWFADQDGSLSLNVAGTDSRSAWYHEASQVPLSDIINKEVGFAEPEAIGKASFEILLSGPGVNNKTVPTRLIWGPVAGSTGVHRDLQTSPQWRTRTADGIEKTQLTTLQAFSAANPDAVVDHYGVSLGFGSTVPSAAVDLVEFNGCTTNFTQEGSSGGNPPFVDELGSLFGSLFDIPFLFDS